MFYTFKISIIHHKFKSHNTPIDKSRSEFTSTQAVSPVLVDDSSLYSFSELEESSSGTDGTSSVSI